MPPFRTLLLLAAAAAAAVTLRTSDASAQVTPAPVPWWPPPFIVWPPAPAPRPPPAPARAVPAPVLTPGEVWPNEWSQIEEQVFTLTNERRARGALCGGRPYAPAGPLAFDPVLRSAAREHSRDMGTRDYFEHASPDGRSPTDRMRAAGWAGQLGGENIYGGHRDGAPMTAAEVVEGWMESPGHCANIMNPRFRTLGVGFAAAPRSRLGNYWTQDFAG